MKNLKNLNEFFYIIDTDTLWTLKRVDKETSRFLYNEEINPVKIFIRKYGDKYSLKAQLCSIDNSSYSIWKDGSYKDLQIVREYVKKYLEEIDVLNGEDFLKKCIELGCDEKSIEYD